jgi:AcrR family transcriptional regulator
MSRYEVAPLADTTRRRILDTALELFSAQGFAATSTRELSERLGFTKAALYYHFRTKDDLLQALVEPVMAQLAALLDPFPAGAPPLDDVAREHLLAAYLDVIVQHRRLLGVLVQDPSAASRPAMQAGRAFYERLTALLVDPAGDHLAQRTRVRFVLGGLHAAVLFAEPGEDIAMARADSLKAAYAVIGRRTA